MTARMEPLRPQVHGEIRGRDQISYQPGLDCIAAGHMRIEMTQPGAWPVDPDNCDDLTPYACWCLWCGGGVSNEWLPEG